MHGKTIEIFLSNGTADGIVTAEISNWNGKVIKIPRNGIEECGKEFEETKNVGVYLLLVNDDVSNELVDIYVGESENVLERLKQHINSYNSENGKENFYWHTALSFVGKDLNKANIRFIESELSKIIKQNGRYKVLNQYGNDIPLKRAHKAAALEFIDNMKLVVNALGYGVLKEVGEGKAQAELLSCNVEGKIATGFVSAGGFTVLKGSVVSADTTSALHKGYKKLRDNLERDKIIVNNEFVKDYEFNSPSAAASVVKGFPASGNVIWKNKDGIILKEL